MSGRLLLPALRWEPTSSPRASNPPGPPGPMTKAWANSGGHPLASDCSLHGPWVAGSTGGGPFLLPLPQHSPSSSISVPTPRHGSNASSSPFPALSIHTHSLFLSLFLFPAPPKSLCCSSVFNHFLPSCGTNHFLLFSLHPSPSPGSRPPPPTPMFSPPSFRSISPSLQRHLVLSSFLSVSPPSSIGASNHRYP